jgi:hypothetical protein
MIWNNRTKKKKFSREKWQAIGTLFEAVELFNDIRDTGRIRIYLKKLNTSAKQEAWALVIDWPKGTIMRRVEDVRLGELYRLVTKDLPGYVQNID